MELGIFAKTFPGTDAASVLEAVSGAGYAVAQFNLACLGLAPIPDTLDAATAAGVAEASRRTGVGIAAVSATYNMIHPDRRKRDEGRRGLELIVRNATAMDTSLVTLCTGTRDPDDQWRWHPENASASAWSDLVTEMHAAVEVAQAYGIDLGIEPELANVVADAAAARRLLDEIASPRLRIVLDPANLFERATPAEGRHLVDRAIDLLAPEIAMAHAKDRDGAGNFVAAGEGMVDFGHFVGRLQAAGFDGPLVTHGLEAAQAPGVARFLRRLIAEASAS